MLAGTCSVANARDEASLPNDAVPGEDDELLADETISNSTCDRSCLRTQSLLSV
jgi:hypothetical protein